MADEPKVSVGKRTTVEDFEGLVGDRNHITRIERGTVATSALAGLLGARGERPGEHWNRTMDGTWERFKADVAANGIRSPVFVTVDYGEAAVISEGNHRRDAAVELGLPEVPVEIRYFGHAERMSSVGDPDPTT